MACYSMKGESGMNHREIKSKSTWLFMIVCVLLAVFTAGQAGAVSGISGSTGNTAVLKVLYSHPGYPFGN